MSYIYEPEEESSLLPPSDNLGTGWPVLMADLSVTRRSLKSQGTFWLCLFTCMPVYADFVKKGKCTYTMRKRYPCTETPASCKLSRHAGAEIIRFFFFHIVSNLTFWRLWHFLVLVRLFGCFYNLSNPDKDYKTFNMHMWFVLIIFLHVYMHMGDLSI